MFVLGQFPHLRSLHIEDSELGSSSPVDLQSERLSMAERYFFGMEKERVRSAQEAILSIKGLEGFSGHLDLSDDWSHGL